MAAGKDKIRKALLQSILNGRLGDLEKYLESQIKNLPSPDDAPAHEEAVKKSEAILLSRFGEIKDCLQVLNNPQKCTALSDYVSAFLTCHRLSASEFRDWAGVSPTDLDTILRPPSTQVFSLTGSVIAKVCHAVNLEAGQAAELARKTLRLAFLEKTTGTSMARYNDKNGSDSKSLSMRKARQELLLKASLASPFKVESEKENQEKIDKKVEEIIEAYEQLG